MIRVYILSVFLLGLLIASCSGKNETNADSEWSLEDWIPVVILNGDTVNWNNQSVDTVRSDDTYSLKMYFPIKDFYKSGTNLLAGETKMQLSIDAEEADNAFKNLSRKYFTVIQDTGRVEFSMDSIISRTSSNSLFWTATIIKPDTAFALRGNWIIER